MLNVRDMTNRSLSRRGFVVSAAALGGLVLCGPGCSSHDVTDDIENPGFDIDTENPMSEEMTLKIYVDERVGEMDVMDGYVERYKSNKGRENITLDFEYVAPDKLSQMCEQGSPDADGVIGLSDVVKSGVDTGVVEGGRGNASIRALGVISSAKLTVIHKKGSSADMPPSKAKDGKESPDGTVNRVQNLAALKGTLALPEQNTLEGKAANQLLNINGLYSSDTGLDGTIDKSVAKKIIVLKDADAVIRAVKKGKASLGMILDWQANQAKGVERIYEPVQSGMDAGRFSGASLVASQHGAVVRDFMSFVSYLV